MSDLNLKKINEKCCLENELKMLRAQVTKTRIKKKNHTCQNS